MGALGEIERQAGPFLHNVSDRGDRVFYACYLTAAEAFRGDAQRVGFEVQDPAAGTVDAVVLGICIDDE